MNSPRAYLRKRGRKLEAVVVYPGGRKVTRATGLDVGQEVEGAAFLQVLEAELAGAPVARAGSPTLRMWGDQWVAERKARGILSADVEEAQLRCHAYPLLGDVPIAELTKARMLEWVRGLASRKCDTRGREGAEETTLSPRTVHHVASTVRRLLAEAVDRELLPASPCTWRTKRDLPPKLDKVAGKRNASGFAGWEVWQLLHDDRVPQDRRVMYALDFLTGMRPGEVAVRRWRDLDTTTAPLWRLNAATAYNSRHYVEKSTKTNVEKIIPVHPVLADSLRAWWAGGWEAYIGRAPEPDDLIVPREHGGTRTNSQSNKRFQADLRRLGLREGRTHYETRSTFRSLAIAGGAPRQELDLITHPSPREAKDLYTRLETVWPAMCRAVLAVQVAQRSEAEAPPSGEVARGVAVFDPEKEKARRLSGLGPSVLVGAAGFESTETPARTRLEAPPGEPVRPETPPRALVAALARAAAAAADAGDLAQAQALLEGATRALGGETALPLRVVGGTC